MKIFSQEISLWSLNVTQIYVFPVPGMFAFQKIK